MKRFNKVAVLALVTVGAVLSAARPAPAICQEGGGGPQPVPNTECPTDNPPFGTGGILVVGCGLDLSGALANGLGAASGVICYDCPNEDQCDRLVHVSDGSTFAVTGAWRLVILGVPCLCVTGLFTGMFDVDCAAC